MTTKDWIYLVVVHVAAVIFFYNGYLSGLKRARQEIQELLNDSGPGPSELPPATEPDPFVPEPIALPTSRNFLTTDPSRNHFRNN